MYRNRLNSSSADLSACVSLTCTETSSSTFLVCSLLQALVCVCVCVRCVVVCSIAILFALSTLLFAAELSAQPQPFAVCCFDNFSSLVWFRIPICQSVAWVAAPVLTASSSTLSCPISLAWTMTSSPLASSSFT